jgi:glycosyltransferase involved in cell wall biosynthesis
MKILLINSYHYNKGGADAVYFNTAQLLKLHGHEVFYFSAKSPENIESQTDKYFTAGNDYRKLSIWKKITSISSFINNRDAYHKLVQLLDEIKPDISHIHLFLGGLSSSILLALKEKKIPVIHSVHDYRLICPAYLFLDGKNKLCEKCKDGLYLKCIWNKCSENSYSQSSILAFDAYFRKYIIKPVNYIDRFIFVSQFIKQKHIEFEYKFGQKAATLYNFNPGLESILPSDKKGSYFLFFGRISREKGILTLIEAAIRAKIVLNIVGKGPLYDQLKDQNYNSIKFLGYKSGEELWLLIRNASFIIVPSEWYENNPMTIIEAYSFGKPVIGARIGGIPEIVKESKTGYLFDAGSVADLETKLRDADNISVDEYKEMSLKAREFADDNFSPEKHYDALITIYKEGIKNKIIL